MKKVLKRCRKCGDERLYAPRVQRCRAQRYGNLSYWCYGRLDPVQVEPKAPSKKAPLKPQEVARRKLRQVERAIESVQEETLSLSQRLGKLAVRSKALAAKARRYSAAASMTDEEVEALRQKQLAQRAKREQAQRTRSIELD